MNPVPNEQDAEWVPELVWIFWRRTSYCPCQKSNHRPSNPKQYHYAQYRILSPHTRGSTCGICGEQRDNVQVFMQVSHIKTFTFVSSKFSANIVRTALSYFNISTTYSRLHVSQPCLCLVHTDAHSRFSIFFLRFQGFHLTFHSEYFTFPLSITVPSNLNIHTNLPLADTEILIV